MTENEIMLALLKTDSFKENSNYSEKDFQTNEKILESPDSDPVALSAAIVINGCTEEYDSKEILRKLVDTLKNRERAENEG